MKRLEPSELQVTEYRIICDQDSRHHRYAPDRGIVSAFCGLLWLLLLVGSVAYVGGLIAQTLQQSGGQAHVR